MSGDSSGSGEDSDRETHRKVCTVKHEITNGRWLNTRQIPFTLVCLGYFTTVGLLVGNSIQVMILNET